MSPVTTNNMWSDWRSERLPVPGVPTAYAYTQIDRQWFGVAPAVTWQFRENTFMHPYVSGGVKVSLLEEHSFRDATTQRSGADQATRCRASTSGAPSSSPGRSSAGGFKSYINRSVFVRTEGRVAFAQDGVRQVSAVIGVGVDF
jgi:hypothetical protein